MVAFIEYALSGKKIGFDKVIAMIDEMVATLKSEQADDDSKKEYCESELDKAEDKKKGLAQDVSDLETAIDDETEAISTLKTEIEALDDGIRALDKEVAEATENRQAEHEEFKATYPANAAAVDLLKFVEAYQAAGGKDETWAEAVTSQYERKFEFPSMSLAVALNMQVPLDNTGKAVSVD